MGIAAICFRWTPEVFWNSTAHEWWAAFEVYQEMHKQSEERT